MAHRIDDKYYDRLETRDPQQREATLFGDLPALIRHAKERAPAIARLLADVDARAVNDRRTLAQIPVIHKSDLAAAQGAARPFGGYAYAPPGTLARVFASPGPIYEPDAHERDYWRFARALFAAGVRRGDLLHNSFAYHFTPAGMMLETAAHAIGAAVFPAGPGNREAQARAIADLAPAAYAGTPDFLKILVDRCDELGVERASLSKGLVSGAALPASLRAELDGRGVAVLQCYGTADLGLIAYESEAREGMILDEKIIVEIVRPGTGDPASGEEVGEVVVTTFNRAYPLIRFATGDLSATMPGPSPCGRTNQRIKGWLGRADQTAKIKGMFVHPGQIADVLKRHAEVARGRLVVTRDGEQDVMTLVCECDRPGDPTLAAAIAASLRAATRLGGAVELTPAGTLPNDGKVIADERLVG